MMSDARIVDGVAELVRDDDFVEPLHQRIFAAIKFEVAEGRPPSPVLLSRYFADDPAMQALGGPGYLSNLTGSGIALIGTWDFARALADLGKRRRLLERVIELQSEIQGRIDLPIEQLVDSIDGAMNDAMQRADRSSATTAAETWDETLAEIEDEAAGKIPRGVVIGRLPDWNEIVGDLRPGEVTILAGRPSMGKTAVGLGVALGSAQAGAGTLFISLEMKRRELMKRAITDLIFVHGESASFDNVQRGKFTAFDRQRLVDARAAIENWPLIFTDPALLHIGRLAMMIRRYQRRMTGRGQELKVVVIDYLGLIKSDDKKAKRYEEVSEVSRTIKRVAKECGVAIVLLSQLSRAVEQREDKRPMLSDLRDAGDIEQDADNVVFVYREEYYLERCEPDPADTRKRPGWENSMDAARDRVDLICAKRRNGKIGHRRCYFFGSHQAVRGSRFYQDMRV
jgi:replicative DNA helicase